MKIIKNLGFMAAIFGAAVIGGVSTTVVTAAIPSSDDGKIHACYRDKGALRVIDIQNGQVCASQETALSWGQSSASSPEDAYTRLYGTYNPTTGAIDGFQDISLSKYVSDVTFLNDPTGTGACITVTYEPRNIAVTGGGTFGPITSVKVAGTNPSNDGWTLPEAQEKCRGTTANAYLGTLGTEAWLIFKR